MKHNKVIPSMKRKIFISDLANIKPKVISEPNTNVNNSQYNVLKRNLKNYEL